MSDNTEALRAELKQWRDYTTSPTIQTLPARPFRTVIDDAIAALAQQAATPPSLLPNESVLALARAVLAARKAATPQTPDVSDLLAWAVEDGVIRMSKVMDADLQDALVRFAKRIAAARQAATPAPAGYALVPLRPNREMERVMAEEDWRWEEVLAAAGTVSEVDYEAAAQAATPAPAEPQSITIDDEAALATLRDYVNATDEPVPLSLSVGAGHSGYGIYLWESEVPDEGAVFLQSVAAPPATPAAQPAEWTITAPDGRQWTGPSAFRVASTAHKETMTPEQRDTLLRTIRLEQEEADRQMLADHEHLNCPACGGSGHVEDARDGWIAVADRLPEPGQDVLFYSDDLRNPVDMLAGRLIDGRWLCAGYEMTNVTHWRPLPAAPSEGSHG